jgi:hypothetical protein
LIQIKAHPGRWSYSWAMFRNRIAQDLSLLTVIKLIVIAAIYFALFAAYDGKPVDTASHLLGPAKILDNQGS